MTCRRAVVRENSCWRVGSRAVDPLLGVDGYDPLSIVV